MALTRENTNVRAAVKNVWNVMVQQLDCKNPNNTVVIDAIFFRDLEIEVKAGVLAEFAKFLNEPVSAVVFIKHNDLIIIGPQHIMEPKYRSMFPLHCYTLEPGSQTLASDNLYNHINEMAGTTPEIDPKNPPPDSSPSNPIRREQARPDDRDEVFVAKVLGPTYIEDHTPNNQEEHATGRGPRRPPNAFILYRKDKAPVVRMSYPGITNNETSVVVGTLWQNEDEEVKNAYVIAASKLKQRFLRLNPGYRYNPRRSSEIPRRSRGPRAQLFRAHIPRVERFRFESPVSERPTAERRTLPPAEPHDENGIFFGNANARLPEQLENTIHTRFPGTTQVYHGPIETTIVQKLPFRNDNIITTISNENLEGLMAVPQHQDGASLLQENSTPEQLSFQDTPSMFPPVPEASDLHFGIDDFQATDFGGMDFFAGNN